MDVFRRDAVLDVDDGVECFAPVNKPSFSHLHAVLLKNLGVVDEPCVHLYCLFDHGTKTLYLKTHLVRVSNRTGMHIPLLKVCSLFTEVLEIGDLTDLLLGVEVLVKGVPLYHLPRLLILAHLIQELRCFDNIDACIV